MGEPIRKLDLKIQAASHQPELAPDELRTPRGGWTWYTGSAGWMYRLIVDYFSVWRYRETVYHVAVSNSPTRPFILLTTVMSTLSR